MNVKKIVLFASGNGSNVEQICKYFENNNALQISKIMSNNLSAKVLDRAKQHKVPSCCFSRREFQSGAVLKQLLKLSPDLIVLAGFLWKVPTDIISAFPDKIINIHPALLPKYGGKGMYGHRVHEAVKKNDEKETGITIHHVNECYDEGAIIFQKSVALTQNDTPESIAQKVQKLEHEYFPKVIENIITEEIKPY